MSENKNIAKNTIVLYVRLLISTAIGLYSSRLILIELGADDFCLYAVVGGMVAMMNFMNSSMIATSNRFIAVELGKKNDSEPNRIFNSLAIFKRTKVIKGFVPQVFRKLNKKEKYSVVFFDCDLYQPALDTYSYFWDKLQKGGIFVIHDNIANHDEWTGVRQASLEFFNPRGIKFNDLWETTMSVIVK